MSDEEEDRTVQQADPEEVELPEIGSLVYMYVTHVQSPKNICMRNIDGDNDRALMDMEDDLTDFVRDNATVLTSVQVCNTVLFHRNFIVVIELKKMQFSHNFVFFVSH